MRSNTAVDMKRMYRSWLGVFIPLPLFIAFLGVLVLCGLSAQGQAPSSLAREMLQPTYPEEFFFNASPTDVWQAVSEEVKLIPSTRVLVSEGDDMVLSWAELPDQTTPSLKPKPSPVASTPDSRHGKGISAAPANPSPAALAYDPVRLKEAEVAEVGEDRVAVTTVIVMVAPKGSIIRFRRIYYGSHTQPRIAYSTGAYESWMVMRLSKRLGLQP